MVTCFVESIAILKCTWTQVLQRNTILFIVVAQGFFQDYLSTGLSLYEGTVSIATKLRPQFDSNPHCGHI